MALSRIRLPNSSKSSVSPAAAAASSAASLATVRMVPSFGFITALYAVSTALEKAREAVFTSSSSCSVIVLENPLKSWERITPEFPLAPRREPDEIALANAFMFISVREETSPAADMIVIVILVPVSPSGTGNTLSSLIYSFCDSSLPAPARNMRESRAESTFVMLTK